jgi:hypothetical protein
MRKPNNLQELRDNPVRKTWLSLSIGV